MVSAPQSIRRRSTMIYPPIAPSERPHGVAVSQLQPRTSGGGRRVLLRQLSGGGASRSMPPSERRHLTSVIVRRGECHLDHLRRPPAGPKDRKAEVACVFVVDASGSMGAEKRMESAKGAVLSLLEDAYKNRDRIGLVAFRGDDADVLLPPLSRSVELAYQRLSDIPTGGRTPLALGLEKGGLQMLERERKKRRDILPMMMLISDGRANAGMGGERSARRFAVYPGGRLQRPESEPSSSIPRQYLLVSPPSLSATAGRLPVSAAAVIIRSQNFLQELWKRSHGGRVGSLSVHDEGGQPPSSFCTSSLQSELTINELQRFSHAPPAIHTRR